MGELTATDRLGAVKYPDTIVAEAPGTTTRALSGPSRLQLVRRMLAAGAIVLVGTSLFLLSPPLPDAAAPANCVRNVHLPGPLQFALNCDSILFVRAARHPAELFAAGYLYQERPIYVLAGAALGRVLEPIPAVLSPSGFPMAGTYFPYYLAFILINAAAVWGAVYLFDRLVDGGRPWSWTALVLAVPLVVNDVVKAFFWSPHTQMFTLVAPVLTVLAVREALAGRPSRPAAWLGVGVVLGMLTLTYALFAITLIGVSLAIALRWRRSNRGRRRGGMALAALWVGSSLPVAGWIATVVAVNGRFHSEAVTGYRQGIWILDAARDGLVPLATTVLSHAGHGLVVTWWTVLPALAALAVAVVATDRRVLRATLDTQRDLVVAAIVTLVATSAFLFALGFYHWRLSWALVPPLLVLSAVLVTAHEERTTERRGEWVPHPIVTVVVSAWWLFHIVKPGPYS